MVLVVTTNTIVGIVDRENIVVDMIVEDIKDDIVIGNYREVGSHK